LYTFRKEQHKLNFSHFCVGLNVSTERFLVSMRNSYSKLFW